MSSTHQPNLTNDDTVLPPPKNNEAGEKAEESSNQALFAADYEQLLDDYSGFDTLEYGEIIKGKVIAITGGDVIVDVGFKSEGIISVQEFLRPDGTVDIKPGDEIEVVLERSEDHEGRISLSREKARRVKVWEFIEKAHLEQTVVTGVVVEKTKGGLFVDIGVKAFLPGSQIDTKPIANLDALKGQMLECKVIKINKKRNNIVLSRRIVIEERKALAKSATIEHLVEGAVVSGTVKNLTDYGVFVDLGGIDGLLHISDITWGRPKHPSNFFSVGDPLQVKVLKFEREKERVSLGYKQLQPDPWETATESYPVGSRVKGKVVSLTDYGAFVELEGGIEGLIHISEMSWNKRAKAPSKLLPVGTPTEAVVLDIHPQERKISLGLKQLSEDPWLTMDARHPVGSMVSGRVRNLTEFGAFVEVEDGIDGLAHISDLTWNRHVKHPSEVVKKGEQLQAVVLKVDVPHRRLSLGVKQLHSNIWENFFSSHRVGEIISGTVVRYASFGAFVELAEGIEGLCHISEYDEQTADKASLGQGLGETIPFRIIRLLPHEKRIGLSLKAVAEPLEENEGEDEADHQPMTLAAGVGSGNESSPVLSPSNPAHESSEQRHDETHE